MTGTAHNDNTAKLKEFNQFWHPMSSATGAGNAGNYDSTKEIECQVQIGSKLYPEYPLRSVSETFSQLKKTMGIHQSPFHSLDIDGAQYRDYKFIIGIDTEKVLEAGFTGLNTRAGDLMTIKVKPMDSTGIGDNKPTKFFQQTHSSSFRLLPRFVFFQLNPVFLRVRNPNIFSL